MLDWKKVVLYPVAIYAVIFLFISALIGAKVDTESIGVWVATLIINIVALYIAARATGVKDLKNGLGLGLTWLAVMIVLDIFLTRPFTGWEFFAEWETWLAYVLTVLIPTLISTQKKK